MRWLPIQKLPRQSIDRQTVLMRARTITWLFCWLALGASGCSKHTPAQAPISERNAPANVDACALISKEEVEAVQGSPIKETKSSERSNGVFRVAQCFYTAAEFSKSVSLAVTQRDPASAATRSPKDFWKETFGRYTGEEKEREEDKEKKESLREQTRGKAEEEESVPPKKIDRIGDEAYWIGNRFGGALYVLKKDAFIRISVGGPDNEETKINKSKALGQKALERL
jgi:hypothetical protein